MHFNRELPARIAAGAVRDEDAEIEIIGQVGGGEVRNELWPSPLRAYEVPFPNMKEDDADFQAILDLWKTVTRAHTFNHVDPLDGETVRVRFDSKLSVTHVAGPFHAIETMLLVEVRD